MNQTTNTRIDQLVEVAAEQSRRVAERREILLKLPPPSVRTGGARLALLPAWSVAVTTILLLVSAGGTWALIQPRAFRPAVVPPTLGEALEGRAGSIGPTPVLRVKKAPAPTVDHTIVRELSPQRVVAKSPAKTPMAQAKVERPSDKSGHIVFSDRPNGDMIIVIPKAKQKPLWTPADFAKYMRKRMGGRFSTESKKTLK